MKKTLVSLAVLSLYAGIAQAASNVTLYGVVDIGYVKETGRSTRMGDNDNNRIGIRGSEDLNGGLKATFEIEQRFDLNDGTLGNSNTASYKGKAKSANGKQWDGPTNVGLAGDWGHVRFGRVHELTTQTIRKFDPFNQIGVGSQIYGVQRNRSLDNTVRYDSPKWNGFSLGTSYSLGQNSQESGVAHDQKWSNDGYAINLSYDNGPYQATTNWSRVADSNDSRVWNVGLGYKFLDTAKVLFSYENNHGNGWKGGNSGTGYNFGADAQQQNWLLGLQWEIGNGRIDTSVQYGRLKNVGSHGSAGSDYWTHGSDNQDIIKYALGYTHNLSKRTAVYGMAAYTKYDDWQSARFFQGLDRDSVTGVQVGITHKF